jgi:glycosyltransferase involved in cell wall biosynthesis
VKVLHINTSDTAGGAAVAAVRLLKALRALGTEAQMLTLEATAGGEGIVPLIHGPLQKPGKMVRFLAEAFSHAPQESGRVHRFAFSPGRFGYDISRHPLVRQADVLHLHWINQGFISLSTLLQLVKLGKPIVWTLHDMWPFTGGCHYSGECLRFVAGCGQCPLLKRSGENDASSRQHAKKRIIFKDARVVWVGCSQWMSDQVGRSGVIKAQLGHDIRSVFNPIDTHLFSPGSREEARQVFHLPPKKKLLLFGAANVNDPRKGIGHLVQALHQLNRLAPSLRQELELVVFGKNACKLKLEVPYVVNPVNFVETQEKMAQLYRAANVFVLPSLQDNLPNTVMESLACGTPVSAFRVGGVPEMVEHLERGSLAPLGDDAALAKGLNYLLTSPGSEERQANARSFVEKNCAPEVVARQYLEIYQSLKNRGDAEE